MKKKRSHLLLLPFQSKVLKKFGYVNWSVIFFFLFWSPSNFTCTSICSQCMAKDNASIIDGNSFKWKNFRCCGCPIQLHFFKLLCFTVVFTAGIRDWLLTVIVWHYCVLVINVFNHSLFPRLFCVNFSDIMVWKRRLIWKPELLIPKKKQAKFDVNLL